VYSETASQIAGRWINEFRNGIEGTGIKPGFIKLSVEYAPLSPIQKKVIEAGGIASQQTGLTVAVHSGDGNAAREALQILIRNDVPPDKFIWVHAQNEKDSTYFIEAAGKGAWVEFDGLDDNNVARYLFFIDFMKQNRLLHRTLISHDAGYYSVGEKNGGQFRAYTTLFLKLLPALEKKGFTKKEIEQLIKTNPARAYSVNDN
jgi:phosphotriesterase-related protein